MLDAVLQGQAVLNALTVALRIFAFALALIVIGGLGLFLRHGQELSYRLRARKKRIVPIAMKLTGFDIERLKLIVGDL